MQTAPRPEDDSERVERLRSYAILDTLDEDEYDDITRLVAQICGTPMANVSFVDRDRQWFKSVVGLTTRETNRDIAFCAHTILGSDIFVVEDASQDSRFHDNPLVTGNPHIRFYAGMPLETPDGYRLGSLCALDTSPRRLSPEQEYALRVLARHVVDLLELRSRTRRLQEVSEVKSRLMAIMAHDMRSPIASLSSMLSLLTEHRLSGQEQDDLLVDLKNTLESTGYLIDNIVSWAAQSLGSDEQSKTGLKLNHDHLQVSEIFYELQASVLPEFDRKHNTLSLEIEVPEVLGDHNVLFFVLRNLLMNANKFTTAGSVRLCSRATKNGTALVVADNGVGMEEETRDRLFSWEHRLRQPGTNGERGSGLALLLSHDMCSRMGARLTVESEANTGSTFSILIPQPAASD